MFEPIKNLSKVLQELPDCSVEESTGQPSVARAIEKLPDDLREFYAEFGGMSLFVNSAAHIKIVGPREFVPANLEIAGELHSEDISSHWYTLAKHDGQPVVTIDLHPERLGRCYDSFWDRHAVVGSSSIIALSFSEWLSRVVQARSNAHYWLFDSFVPYGDAYD
jgi:hypothetical protein